MRTVLITGPIGAGKSEVRRYLERRGFSTYDCDSRCKALYDEVPGLKTEIESSLGIPFRSLSSVFEDPSKLALLESLVFPYLTEDIVRWKRSASGRLVFIESATALSKPQFDGLYDETWIVTAPAAVRLSRNPKAAQRDSFQSFDTLAASHVIENDSTPEALFEKINKLVI